MITVNIHEAKTHLSKLVDSVAQGNVVVIAKAGKPAAKLIPITRGKRNRKPGLLKNKIKISQDFDAPLPNDILESFKG